MAHWTEQLNDEPSMYRDFLRSGHESLQHVAYWTEAMDEDLARIDKLGYTIGQSGTVSENGRFVYLCTESHPGTVVELSEISSYKGKLFRVICEAATTWDGTNPIIAIER